MDLEPLRQDITTVLEECYSLGMQLPFLFVAVSLDGKLIGVRFTEAEDNDGLDGVPIAGNPNALATMPMSINVMIVGHEDMRRGEGRTFTRAAELEFLYRSFEPTIGPTLFFDRLITPAPGA